ncbi:hypothetical protein BH11PSE2_BH11PSE2_15030 [soil metagenome]
MPDRVFFPLVALAAILLIALALAWPQGTGRRSPPPFGHEMAKPALVAPVKPAVPAQVPAK